MVDRGKQPASDSDSGFLLTAPLIELLIFGENMGVALGTRIARGDGAPEQ